MNSPATDMATMLQAAAVGTFAATTGWGIYVNREPENPDTTITLYDYAGLPVDDLCRNQHDDFRVQVRVKANTYPVAYAKALAVEAVLNAVAQSTVAAAYYNVIYRLDLVASLGQDDKDRTILVQNYAGLRSAV